MEVLKEELNSTSTYVPAQLTKDKLLLRHIDSLTKSNIKIDNLDLPTFYWLPKLHKNPYKSRFISNSSHCSTTILSKHITSALTAVKDHVIKYSKIEKVPRGIRGEKSSKDMASSRNLVSTIGALASPKMGDGTRCPEG